VADTRNRAIRNSMWLQKLDLNGFKSFAQASTLEFLPPTETSRGITAIVGPNGSGKSCVVDSIRWVLGEQSMKLLRGKRAEDVIFAGTPKRARLGVAEVALHLNNEDGSAPIDYRDLVVGRRVYRSGESEYLLNNSRVRREDVLLLLAGARVGQRTYSIIGQGMVDEFLMASPAARKSFFDEAAGIRPAELKRDTATRKLDRARTNLEQGEVLLQEILPRLRSLTRHVRRYERRDELAAELRALQIHALSHQWHLLADELHIMRDAWERTDTDRSAFTKEMDRIQTKLATMEEEQENTKDDTFLALQKEYDAIVARKQSLRERLLTIRSRLAAQRTSQTSVPASTLLNDVLALLDDMNKVHTALAQPDDAALERAREGLASALKRLKQIRTACGGDTIDTAPPPELSDTEELLSSVEVELGEIQQRMRAYREREREQKSEFFALQHRSRDAQLQLTEQTSRANDIRVKLARLEQRRDDLSATIAHQFGSAFNVNELSKPAHAPTTDMPARIARLKRDLAAIGTIDQQTLTEYEETKQRAEFLDHQTSDLRQSITAIEKVVLELDREIARAFQDAFQTIGAHFETYFKQLFDGGHAKLTLLSESPDETTDDLSDDDLPDIPPTDHPAHRRQTAPSITGIDIQATPPGKRIKSIAMLSGGERALTAIALLCAIISTSRSPFVILDEVDAALDEANSVRFAEILKDLSKHTQFLVVTHNRATMERAAAIYGITMGDNGASKLLSLKLEEATALTT
jgi:chromosome segregation ATPase